MLKNKLALIVYFSRVYAEEGLERYKLDGQVLIIKAMEKYDMFHNTSFPG